MNFRSVAQLSDQILHWTRQLPKDIDLVVGVPRSGLLAANLLGLYLNVPVTDVEGFLAGRILKQGRRGRKRMEDVAETDETFLSRSRKVFVLDDSVYSGRSISKVRDRINSVDHGHEIMYGAVYIHPEKYECVDVYCESLYSPLMFEWNVMHHPHLSSSCLVIDGVLCQDATREDDDDGNRYSTFLQNAQPYLIPTVEVGWLVTSRLEKYRADTVAWLKANGVRYRNLIMLDYPTLAWREELGTPAAFKAEVYRSTGARIFIESSIKQAVEISRLANREVICIDSMQLVTPGNVPASRSGTLPDLHQPRSSERITKGVRQFRNVVRWPAQTVKRALTP